MTRQRLGILPLVDARAFKDALMLGPEGMTLRALLDRHPALATAPVEEGWRDRPADDFDLRVVDSKPDAAVYRPPGLQVRPVDDAGTESSHTDDTGDVSRVPARQETKAAEGDAIAAPEKCRDAPDHRQRARLPQRLAAPAGAHPDLRRRRQHRARRSFVARFEHEHDK